MTPLNWGLSGMPPIVLLALILAVIWSTTWKGIALWRAARSAQFSWFIVLFLVNTLGILEIIYIFALNRSRKPFPAA